jgi:diguanylate cyclase (GGDEF)-like protein
LRTNLRSYDLIFRYGGDEFITVLTGLDLKAAVRRFELVGAALSADPDPVSVTIGIAEVQPDDTAEDVVARADAVLYRTRQQQRELTD